MTDQATFGTAVRAIRSAKRISFSEMIRRTGLNAVDYSKMERGLMPAPKDKNKLDAIQRALVLSGDSTEWVELLSLAQRGIPLISLDDAQLAGKLPSPLTVPFVNFGTEQEEALIAMVRQANTSEPDREVAWQRS